MRDNQSGTSMIELLVTLVITATGLLTLAYSQLANLRTAQGSQYRTLATLYAYDMAERMRANSSAVADGLYDDIDGDETDPACTTTCTPGQLAQRDAFQWNSNIRAVLPSGVGSVSFDGVTRIITITWDQQAPGPDLTLTTTEQTFELPARL